MFVLLFMGVLLIPTAGNAADAADELTAQEKYDALKAKGIFAGLPDGAAGLDQNMTRAQFAKVAALILDLEGIGELGSNIDANRSFDDVPLSAWYVDYVGAVQRAGIMIGDGNGKFNPDGDISVQELAVATARMLDIDPAQDSDVEGAASWAKGYIQALQDNRVDIPANYTEPATRADLVTTSYAADLVITEKREAEKEAERKEEEQKRLEEEKKRQEEQAWYPAPQPVQVEIPTAFPAGGVVNSGTQVSLSATGGATIYYTIDGSTPTRTNGLVYRAPIVVNGAITIKAIAVQNGMNDSVILSVSYTISMESALDLIFEAVVSGNWDGIYESTFADAGVTGVTDEYLSGIQGILQDRYYFEETLPKTLAQIQMIVDETINLSVINNYFGYDNVSAPDTSTFELAGITGVDDSNLEMVIEALRTAYGGGPGASAPKSKAEIQHIVDDLAR